MAEHRLAGLSSYVALSSFLLSLSCSVASIDCAMPSLVLTSQAFPSVHTALTTLDFCHEQSDPISLGRSGCGLGVVGTLVGITQI